MDGWIGQIEPSKLLFPKVPQQNTVVLFFFSNLVAPVLLEVVNLMPSKLLRLKLLFKMSIRLSFLTVCCSFFFFLLIYNSHIMKKGIIIPNLGEEDSDEGEDSDEDENSDDEEDSDEDESNIGICFLCDRHTTENGGDWDETEEWVCDICLPYCVKCGEILRSRVDECCGDFWRSDFRKEWQDKLKKEREPIKAIEVKAIKDAKDTKERAIVDARNAEKKAIKDAKDTRERAIVDAKNTEKQAIKDAKDAKKKAIKDAKDAKKRKAHRKKFMKQDSEAEEEDDSK